MKFLAIDSKGRSIAIVTAADHEEAQKLIASGGGYRSSDEMARRLGINPSEVNRLILKETE